MLTEFSSSLAASAAVNAQATGTMAHRPVAGILVRSAVFGDVDKLSLSVTLRRGDAEGKGRPAEILCAAVPLFPIAERADFAQGVGFGQNFVIQGTTDTETEDLAHAMFVADLGNIKLRGDDRLEASVRVTSALGGSSEVRAAFVHGDPEAPERILKISETAGTAPVSTHCLREAYAYRTSGSGTDQAIHALTAGQLSIIQKSETDEAQWDVALAAALTGAIGRMESQGPRRTAVVFLSSKNYEACTLRLSGTDVANYGLLLVEEVLTPEAAGADAVDRAERMSAKVRRMSVSKPEVLQALRKRAA